MKDFKFTTTFSSIVKPLVAEEKDKYLALASLADIGSFIPEVNAGKNVDLLPVAFNAFVVNRVNKNGDVIDTESALGSYKSFINKPINLEHNRQKVIGVILNAGFSEFGTDLPLTEEQVKDFKGPFNVTLGGVIWRIVNPQLSDLIEDSSDPTGNSYQKVSASWELGFSEYHLAVMEDGEKNIENSYIITDSEKIQELKGSLRSLGGSGKLEDGRRVYRKVIGDIVPLGIGLTENPAADVKGIATKREDLQQLVVSSSDTEETLEKQNTETLIMKTNLIKESENIISQSKEMNVIEIKENLVMEIKSIADITDESLKQVKASTIAEFIESEMKSASEKFSVEKNEIENALKASKEETENLTKASEVIKAELAELKNALEMIKAEQIAAEKLDKFNERMAALEAEFQFDDELRAEIAGDIKDLDEESYSAYHGKMAKMAKGLTKKQEKLPDFIKDKIEDKEAKEKCDETKASENTEQVVEEAIDKAEKSKQEVPVSMAAEEPTLTEKYKKAFSVENFEIKF